MKQVIPQRTIFSTRSSFKPRRRGLSLTSHSRCASSQKPQTNKIISWQQSTLQSQITNHSNFQFIRAQQRYSYSSKDKCTAKNRQSFLTLTEHTMKQKPKITFRYTNQLGNQVNCIKNVSCQQRNNSFILMAKPSIIQYQKRYLNSFGENVGGNNNNFVKSSNINQHLIYVPAIFVPQKYTIIKSVQKRAAQNYSNEGQRFSFNRKHNYSISKNQPSCSYYPNNNKLLIDSRRIERQIITQQKFSNIPSCSRISSESYIRIKSPQSQNLIPSQLIQNPNPIFIKQDLWTKSITTSQIRRSQQNLIPEVSQKYINLHQTQQLEYIQKSGEKYRSPYHLLISTAKKCQSKQVSPSKLNKGEEKVSQLGLLTLERIPQINQFNLKNESNEVAYQIDIKTGKSKNKDKKYQVSNSKQKNEKHKQEQVLRVKQLNTVWSQKASKHQSLYVPLKKGALFVDRIIENKKVEQYKPKQSKSPSAKKQKNLSTNKKLKQQMSLLSQIQNKAPTVFSLTNTVNKSSQNRSSLANGKRNCHRIKQIQKRLQQIITICDKNL